MASKKIPSKPEPKPKFSKDSKDAPGRGKPETYGIPREAEQSPRGTKPAEPKKK
jgi:hypothetical protein